MIYLDYNASTPVAPEVARVMEPLLARHYGNPSSAHDEARGAAEALRGGRAHVAALIGASAQEVVFTSGGSEANNWAIKGVVLRALRERPDRRPRVVISAVEHPSVVQPCRWLEGFGATVTVVPVDHDGTIRLDALESAIDRDTVLVSVMHANNEVGTIEPIAEVAAAAHRVGALLHCDAAQSVGKIDVKVAELGVDLLTIAGHKLYAPKGVGALFVEDGVQLDSLVHGGGQEHGRRAGTESALLGAALGAACALARQEPCAERLRALTERLWDLLRSRLGARVVLHGHPTERLPNTINVGFVDRVARQLLARTPELAASAGSACHSGTETLSSVLSAMGIGERSGLGAVRFSVGRYTTEGEIDEAVEHIAAAYGD